MTPFYEPWELAESTTDAPCSNASIDTKNGFLRIHVRGGMLAGIGADKVAERIVACVNYCAEMPIGSLEGRKLWYATDEKLRALSPKADGLTCASDLPGFESFQLVMIPVVKEGIDADQQERTHG